MKSAVIIFPGSNCDRDAITALTKFSSKVEKIWHKDSLLPNDLDLILIPGGFSYGDYLRSGAMASKSPIINEVRKASDKGIKILGICNGFQILTEANLLDGVLLRNQNIKFICKSTSLKVMNNQTTFTAKYQKNDQIEIPIAHMDGRYFTDPDSLKRIEDNDQIAFKYISNPNGSVSDIAGIFNKQKNVLGMMPHPERAVDQNTGSTDGIKLFESIFQTT